MYTIEGFITKFQIADETTANEGGKRVFTAPVRWTLRHRFSSVSTGSSPLDTSRDRIEMNS